MSCVICTKRKEKRFCPAVHGRICPQCCGEQREVTLDCPRDCAYLQQARQHEKPRPIGELDQASLFRHVAVSEHYLYEHEHLIAGLTYALAKSARTGHDLTDAELLSALSAITKTYDTLVNSGLHYESPMSAAYQQAIAAEIQTMVKDYRETELKHLGFTRLKDEDVLRGLVFLVRMAMARTSGRPRSRAFIEFLYDQFPEKQSLIATPQESGSSIIVP